MNRAFSSTFSFPRFSLINTKQNLAIRAISFEGDKPPVPHAHTNQTKRGSEREKLRIIWYKDTQTTEFDLLQLRIVEEKEEVSRTPLIWSQTSKLLLKAGWDLLSCTSSYYFYQMDWSGTTALINVTPAGSRWWQGTLSPGINFLTKTMLGKVLDWRFLDCSNTGGQ